MKGYISKEGRRSECVRKEGEFYGYVHINLEININLYISIAYLCVFLIFYKEAAYEPSEYSMNLVNINEVSPKHICQFIKKSVIIHHFVIINWLKRVAIW